MIYNMDVSWWFTYILLPQTKSEAIPKITRTSTGYTQSLCTFLLTHTAMCNGCLLELLVWWSCGLLVCTINRGERVLVVIKIWIFSDYSCSGFCCESEVTRLNMYFTGIIFVLFGASLVAVNGFQFGTWKNKKRGFLCLQQFSLLKSNFSQISHKLLGKISYYQQPLCTPFGKD